jgi:acyl-CoA thioester hydrolase
MPPGWRLTVPELIARFDYLHRVVADEIDELRHAGNYHYIRWMQHAAVAHSSANGWPSGRYIDLGSGWVVRSHRITYLTPAFENDTLKIRTWVANMRRAASLRRYEMMNEAGERVATAETDWAFINYTRQLPTRIPEQVAACFVVIED